MIDICAFLRLLGFTELSAYDPSKKSLEKNYMTPEETPVSHWMEALEKGGGTTQQSAYRKLWNHFLLRLTGLISNKLRDVPKLMEDVDEVVSDTCLTCFTKLANGQYPDLGGREDLWKLLAKIAGDKSVDLIRRTKTRIDGHLIRASVVIKSDGSSYSPDDITNLESAEPTPEYAAVCAEEVNHLLSILPEKLYRVAILRLEGYTVKEIASQIEQSVPTVERRLKSIRASWTEEKSKE